VSRLSAHRQAEESLQAIASALTDVLPKGVVFTLITYTVGEGGFSAYVSNGSRANMIEALEETLARLKANTVSGPFADVEELISKKKRHDV
jgi:hypothetical protein